VHTFIQHRIKHSTKNVVLPENLHWFTVFNWPKFLFGIQLQMLDKPWKILWDVCDVMVISNIDAKASRLERTFRNVANSNFCKSVLFAPEIS
jgi:hypothetical protein